MRLNLKLSVIIPAKNEEFSIDETIRELVLKLENVIPYEILVVNDYSDDNSEKVFRELETKYNSFKYVNNDTERGVGSAIKFGITNCTGDVIAICMADGSDSPSDVLTSYNIIKEEKCDCVFGSRFIEGSEVIDYPVLKRIYNRVFNNFVKLYTKFKYDDFTNIFKVYSLNAIESIMPIESSGFSIGLEMSLKSFKKELSIKIIPISWRQRKAGESKLKVFKNIRSYFKTLIDSMK